MIYNLKNPYDIGKFKDRVVELINQRAVVNMTTEELNELSKGEGIILAYKEGDSIYPISLDKEDANVLSFFISDMNKEILRSRENEYRKVEE